MIGLRNGRSVFRYVALRTFSLVSTLFFASILVFVVLNVLPGKPAQVILGTQATPESVRLLTDKLGLNKPLYVQYFHWMSGLVSMHLGNSYISGQPIEPEIAAALSVTVPLVIFGMIVGVLTSVPLGVLSAINYRKKAGLFLSAVSQVGIAVPNYVLGVVLITVLAVDVHLFPSSGFVPWSQSVSQAIYSLSLPGISLGLVQAAILSRYIKTAVLDVLNSQYIRTARAKGLRLMPALLRHGMRNASLPILTVLGMELSGLIVGAVVIEAVFTLPGVGTLLLSSVSNRDLIVVQDIVLLVAFVVMAVNWLIDILYVVVDPRIGLR